MGLFGFDMTNATQKTENFQSGADQGASAYSARVGKGGASAANGGIAISLTNKSGGGKKSKTKNSAANPSVVVNNSYTTRNESPEAIAAARDVTLAALDAIAASSHDLAELS